MQLLWQDVELAQDKEWCASSGKKLRREFISWTVGLHENNDVNDDHDDFRDQYIMTMVILMT